MKTIIALFLSLSIPAFLSAGLPADCLISSGQANTPIQPGAASLGQYLPLLKGKRVGIFANHTSVIGNKTHLIDTLLKKGVKITRIFSPEHGFRGNVDDGAKIGNVVDPATGILIVSLYGEKRKPSAEDLAEVDVMIFDIQDVGVRFYTYISSLEYYMEAAIENDKQLIVLDRPNPNGFYVDGPVLDKKYKSFVGMQAIPVVYGLTIGEYARMILGEKWLSIAADKQQSFKKLTIIPCTGYDHNSIYHLPVNPSPNLKDIQSIWLYPSTCYFEGTVFSEGRGTAHPFAIFGHPSLPNNMFAFTPVSMEGATNPKLRDKPCYGWNLYEDEKQVYKLVNKRIQLKWILEAYRLFPEKDKFFLKGKAVNQQDASFTRLAGTTDLQQQIIQGLSEEEIRKSWEPKLSDYKKLRKKYLLYKDFE